MNQPINLNKDETAAANATAGAVIHVGVPGNIRTIAVNAEETLTVADVLNRAELNPNGFELRVAGDVANGTTTVAPGQTVLLLKAVAGAVDLAKPEEQPGAVIHVGVPGNIRSIAVNPEETITVADVLSRAELNANGFELRVAGDVASGATTVAPGQTVLLLKAVAGAAV